MRRLLPLVLALGACRATSLTESAESTDPPLSHGVFFTLADAADADALVRDCETLAEATDGLLAHAVGPRIVDLARPINDQEFDVGLWLLFADRAAHDAYQVSAAHVSLIERWQTKLTGARVFDHAGRGTEGRE